MNIRKLAFMLYVITLYQAVSLFGAEDLFLGTWKLSLERSKYAAGQLPKSGTASVEGGSDAHTVKVQTTTGGGQIIQFSYVAKDGIPAPVTGTPAFDIVVAHKIDDRTAKRKFMKAGKTIMQDRVTVSPDGKLLTVTGSSPSSNGAVAKFTAVYERQ
jgi:hypothetical protein